MSRNPNTSPQPDPKAGPAANIPGMQDTDRHGPGLWDADLLSRPTAYLENAEDMEPFKPQQFVPEPRPPEHRKPPGHRSELKPLGNILPRREDLN